MALWLVCIQKGGVNIRQTPTVCQAPSVHKFSEPSKIATVKRCSHFPCHTDKETET